MAESTQISLSRALKLKNRVVHRLSQLDTQITTYNSVIEDNQEYEVRQLYKARLVLAEQLVRLKKAINAANQPATLIAACIVRQTGASCPGFPSDCESPTTTTADDNSTVPSMSRSR